MKSQEGENEDGKEGELVVKFVDALPKVNWTVFPHPYGREAFRWHPISNITSFPYVQELGCGLVYAQKGL